MGVGRYQKYIFVIVISLLVVSSVSAHVPQTDEGNHTLGTAMHVDDPTKSWVIYSELHHDEANYYEMELKEGQRLKISLLVPDEDFVPNLVVMGPGIQSNDSLPGYIEVPEDVGFDVIEGELGEREYEPFTPASYYYPAEFEKEIDTDGTYYFAVFSEEGEGKYGAAVGYEERYGLIEWIRVPIDVINIHLWEGQPLWLVFSPMIFVVGLGLTGSAWRKYQDGEGPDDVKEWGLLTSSFLYIGSGAMLSMQMGLAVSKADTGPGLIVTLVFALLPVIFGLLLWKRAQDFKEPEPMERVKVVFYGMIGLFVWAGLIVGPIIAVISALLPDEMFSSR